MKKITILIMLLAFVLSFAVPVLAQEEGALPEGLKVEKMRKGKKDWEHFKRRGDYKRKKYYPTPEEVAAYDEETEAAWREIMEYKVKKEIGHAMALGAAIAIGLAVLGGALGQGKAAASALEGIARNPEASGKIFTPLIISLALIESLVIYALVIAFLLQGNV